MLKIAVIAIIVLLGLYQIGFLGSDKISKTGNSIKTTTSNLKRNFKSGFKTESIYTQKDSILNTEPKYEENDYEIEEEEVAPSPTLSNQEMVKIFEKQEEEKKVEDKIFNQDDLDFLEEHGAKIEKSNDPVEPVEEDKIDSDLIPGISSSSSGSSAIKEDSDPIKEETPTPSATPNELYNGQARGYAMLYLMHPRARDTVNLQVQNLIDSNIKNLYLSVLTDGTFDKDFNFLNQVIRKLNQEGRTLTLALYLSNGATMRRFETTEIKESFNTIDPIEFRKLIQSDQQIINKFQNMVSEVGPSFKLNTSLNSENKNIAIVMLEDNLDSESYLAMRNLSKDILGNLVTFIRNPCPGCYEGNDIFTYGDGLELHDTSSISGLDSNDGFTIDGTSMRFSNEPVSTALSTDQLLEITKFSSSKNLLYFGLWRNERQGFSGDLILHPDFRTYEVPSKLQLEEELKILRSGLELN